MTSFHLGEVRTGQLQPLGPKGVPSGIYKHPVQGAIFADMNGLRGDAHGDQRHHGGPDKAIHAYPLQSYADWVADLPDLRSRMLPGAFGENLVVDGVVEADMCLGDQWTVGDVVLEVSQARQPCWRLNLRFERDDMARLVQATGRTGWYFRVLQSGDIAAGQDAQLLARPYPAWSLNRVWHLLYRDTQNRADLEDLATLPVLPARWRDLVLARLASGKTEDWRSRIVTP